jgi:hypothetical protein
MIVKRIHFPDSSYSQNENEFKKILGTYGLYWQDSTKKVYENDKKAKLLTGIYMSPDKSKRILAFYEGHEKPATFIVKILGGGGNFLIDLNSLCHNAGCIVEDRDERYIEDILLRLRNFRDINLPEDINLLEDINKRKDEEKENGKDGKILKKGDMNFFDIKLVRIVRRYLRRYAINNGKSLEGRGISIKVARLFKKKQVKSNAIWVLENGWIEKKKR